TQRCLEPITQQRLLEGVPTEQVIVLAAGAWVFVGALDMGPAHDPQLAQQRAFDDVQFVQTILLAHSAASRMATTGLRPARRSSRRPSRSDESLARSRR